MRLLSNILSLFVCAIFWSLLLELLIEISDFLLEVSLSSNLKRIGPDDLKKVFSLGGGRGGGGSKWAQNEEFKIYEKLTLQIFQIF